MTVSQERRVGARPASDPNPYILCHDNLEIHQSWMLRLSLGRPMTTQDIGDLFHAKPDTRVGGGTMASSQSPCSCDRDSARRLGWPVLFFASSAVAIVRGVHNDESKDKVKRCRKKNTPVPQSPEFHTQCICPHTCHQCYQAMVHLLISCSGGGCFRRSCALRTMWDRSLSPCCLRSRRRCRHPFPSWTRC
jgi:hypothetical protein